MSVLIPVPGCFDYSGLVIQFDSGIVIPPTLFFFLKISAAQFTIAKCWKQPKCPSANEWIKKLWYIYRTEYYTAERKKELLLFATAWMELESIMLSEIS